MKNIYSLLLGLIFIIGISSCKTDTSQASDQLTIAKNAVKDITTAKQYIDEIKKDIATENGNKAALYSEGLRVAEEYKMGSTAVGFLMPLVRDYPEDPAFGERLAKLTSALNDLGRENASSILGQAYFDKFPNGKFKTTLAQKLGSEMTPPKDILKSMAESVFVEPDKYGINRKNAQRYVDACEAFALGFSTDEEAPLYLYRGAEMARTLRTFNKALSIYDWIAEKYPNYEKTPTTLFLKGFMLENELNDKVRAKEVYNQFLKDYPNHELKDDINFLLENIDKSDKEIMEMIESKKK